MIPLLQSCKICGRWIMAILIIASVFTTCFGKSNYLNFIPNGFLVTNPCINTPSILRLRLGHVSIDPAITTKNQFGLDFMKHNNGDLELVWPKLCGMDSDGDNRTNGEELGDPGCTWTFKNQTISSNSVTVITHPGIHDGSDGPVCP